MKEEKEKVAEEVTFVEFVNIGEINLDQVDDFLIQFRIEDKEEAQDILNEINAEITLHWSGSKNPIYKNDALIKSAGKQLTSNSNLKPKVNHAQVTLVGYKDEEYPGGFKMFYSMSVRELIDNDSLLEYIEDNISFHRKAKSNCVGNGIHVFKNIEKPVGFDDVLSML